VNVFSISERDCVQAWLQDRFATAPAVHAFALTGSTALRKHDRWSDIDIFVGIDDSRSLRDFLDESERELHERFGVAHWWDLPSGDWLYRVHLLENGLEVDLGVSHQSDFAAGGPQFRLLKGSANRAPASPKPDDSQVIGKVWHHLFHTRVAIERGRRFQAEYWLHVGRDQVAALSCGRCGVPDYYGKGVDDLPAELIAAYADTMLDELQPENLRRALSLLSEIAISEIRFLQPDVAERLIPLVIEFCSAEE
jgi:hypothetical protein